MPGSGAGYGTERACRGEYHDERSIAYNILSCQMLMHARDGRLTTGRTREACGGLLLMAPLQLQEGGLTGGSQLSGTPQGPGPMRSSGSSTMLSKRGAEPSESQVYHRRLRAVEWRSQRTPVAPAQENFLQALILSGECARCHRSRLEASELHRTRQARTATLLFITSHGFGGAWELQPAGSVAQSRAPILSSSCPGAHKCPIVPCHTPSALPGSPRQRAGRLLPPALAQHGSTPLHSSLSNSAWPCWSSATSP